MFGKPSDEDIRNRLIHRIERARQEQFEKEGFKEEQTHPQSDIHNSPEANDLESRTESSVRANMRRSAAYITLGAAALSAFLLPEHTDLGSPLDRLTMNRISTNTILEQRAPEYEHQSPELIRTRMPEEHPGSLQYMLKMPESSVQKLSATSQNYVNMVKHYSDVADAVRKKAYEWDFDEQLLFSIVTLEAGIERDYRTRSNSRHYSSSDQARGLTQITQARLDDYNRKNPNNQYSWEEMHDYDANLEVFLWGLHDNIDALGNSSAALFAHNKGTNGTRMLYEREGTMQRVLDTQKRAAQKHHSFIEPLEFGLSVAEIDDAYNQVLEESGADKDKLFPAGRGPAREMLRVFREYMKKHPDGNYKSNRLQASII